MNLLDTDIFTLLLRGQARIARRVEEAESVAITVISRIEVLKGRFASILTAANGQQLLQAQHWLEENEAYMRGMTVVPIDAAAAAEFDKLKKNNKLKKIGQADLLIASIVLVHQATLVTRNLKHFRQVPGLRAENWAD